MTLSTIISYSMRPHVIRDMYVTYAFTFTSGSILKWYRNNFGSIYRNEAAKSNINILAGTVSGVYKSIEDAVQRLVKKKKEFYPDEKLH